MRLLIILLLAVTAAFTDGYAQCNPFYNIKEGSIWELTSYNANDKVTGKQVNELKKLNETSNGWVATIHFKSYNPKDKLQFEKEVELECEDGVIKMDMQKFLPQESLDAMEQMNVSLDIEHLEWPNQLKVGAELKDGAVRVNSDVMNMSINITDRKVESKEKITTPAGTFDAFKVTYNTKFNMMMTRESKGVDYIAEGVGIVRSENYNGAGKLTDYVVLTMFK